MATQIPLGPVSVTIGQASLGSMARSAALDLGNALPQLMATGAYIVGAGLAIGGLMKIRKHVEAPQQVPLRDGLAGLALGVALIAIPVMIEAVASSMGADAATVRRPTL